MTNYQEILPTRLRMAGGESLRFGTIALIAFLHARRGRWLRLERTFDEYRELRRSFIFPYNGKLAGTAFRRAARQDQIPPGRLRVDATDIHAASAAAQRRGARRLARPHIRICV
jgi:hypothetical protein